METEHISREVELDNVRDQDEVYRILSPYLSHLEMLEILDGTYLAKRTIEQYENDMVSYLTLTLGDCSNIMFIEDKETDTQVLCFVYKGLTYIVPRGTEQPRDVLTDLKAKYEKFGKNSYHSGIGEAFLGVKDQITSYIKDQGNPWCSFGHSLGGALGAVLTFEIPGAVMLRTFGAPPVTCGIPLSSNVVDTIHFVNDGDLVPRSCQVGNKIKKVLTKIFMSCADFLEKKDKFRRLESFLRKCQNNLAVSYKELGDYRHVGVVCILKSDGERFIVENLERYQENLLKVLSDEPRRGLDDHRLAEYTARFKKETKTPNFDKIRSELQIQMNNPGDLFLLRTELEDGGLATGTIHQLERATNKRFLPYNDERGLKQETLSAFVPENDLVIGVKHHLFAQDQKPLELTKLQCTHVMNVVGVQDGVMTINSPGGYANGLFGAKDYPMTFFRPGLPDSIPKHLTSKVRDNIRTWMVLINTFTTFAGSYNGGDPLNASDKESLMLYGKKILDALDGSAVALDWLKAPENQIYCAELTHLSFNLGLHFPLNKAFLGSEQFAVVKEALSTKSFIKSDENPYLKLVNISVAPEALKPLSHYVEISTEVTENGFWEGLAFTPFKVDDVVLNFLKYSVDRERVGERLGASQQLELFRKVRPTLVSTLGSFAGLLELRSFFDDLENTVGIEYESYSDFLRGIDSLVERASDYGDILDKKYVPPHAFLVRAFEESVFGIKSGQVGLEYLGHGIHESFFDS